MERWAFPDQQAFKDHREKEGKWECVVSMGQLEFQDQMANWETKALMVNLEFLVMPDTWDSQESLDEKGAKVRRDDLVLQGVTESLEEMESPENRETTEIAGNQVKPVLLESVESMVNQEKKEKLALLGTRAMMANKETLEREDKVDQME